MLRYALVVFLLAADTTAQRPPDDPIARLAERTIEHFVGSNRETDLDNLFRLQLGARRFEDAKKTLAELRALREHGPAGSPPVSAVQYEVYTDAKLQQARNGVTFAQAFGDAYRRIIGALDDRTTAVQVQWVFGTLLSNLERDAQQAREQHRDLDSLSQRDAIDLVRKVVAANTYREFAPLLPSLVEEDDQRRYVIERNVIVPTDDGAHICAFVMRPRSLAAKRLPALLNFTIYSGPQNPVDEARRTASHGYAGVEGFTRGKACSPDQPVPIEHDGDDAATLIDWISRQPWSDGRVGMFGGSYDGFTQWAAAKHRPKALKAIMPSVTFAPGIDFPMDGNVFMNYAFPWPFYTTNVKALDDATYFDRERWDRLNRNWYTSGRPYRDLDKIDGTPNPIFDKWIAHPSYDQYWQHAIPTPEESSRIDIPVLTTTGYYDSGQKGALHYFMQHGANHTLVIGPYDHIRGQRGTITPLGRTLDVLRNYPLDPVAQIDIPELRYQWFDFIFRGAPKPALLKERVNYEVMGSNVWKHAPSLAAMHNSTLRFHLDAGRLTARTPSRNAFVLQTIDLADRSDVAQFAPSGPLIDQALDDWNIIDDAPNLAHALTFVSDPLSKGTEVSGLLSGRLDFVANKKDFDFAVTLFELTPQQNYVQLSYFWSRASYTEDRGRRQLLTPGERRSLRFRFGRLTSRRIAPGSRLVIVLSVIKQPGEQINYGSGKDVSSESIADANDPLRIRWYGESLIRIPIWK